MNGLISSLLSSGCWDRKSGSHWVWTGECGSETSWPETRLNCSSSSSLSTSPFISPSVERHVNRRWGSHLLAQSTAAQALISAPQILGLFPPCVKWNLKATSLVSDIQRSLHVFSQLLRFALSCLLPEEIWALSTFNVKYLLPRITTLGWNFNIRKDTYLKACTWYYGVLWSIGNNVFIRYGDDCN